MADSSAMSAARIFFLSIAAAATLLLLAMLLALALALDAAPQITVPKSVATADVERALSLFKRHDPQLQRPGVVRLLALDQRDIDLLLQHVAGRWAGLAVRIQVEQGQAIVQASVLVPFAGRWANVQARLLQAQGLPEVVGFRVGRLALPAWCAEPLIAWMLQRRGLGANPQLARDVVRHVDLRPGRLLVFYAWQEDTSSRMLTALVPPEDQARLKVYSDRLVELVSSEPTGSVISLARLLPPLFAQARQRTAAGSDAALENRAAILILTFYANRQGLAVIVPAARHWRRPMPRTVTLAGRTDTPLHFLVSAALAAESGSPLADAVGLYKELADSQGGSGFSFNDLAADRAGTRFGERALRDAARVQNQLAGGASEHDLFPDVADLPENMSAQQFRKSFGAVGSTAYKQVLSEIEKRLDATALLR